MLWCTNTYRHQLEWRVDEAMSMRGTDRWCWPSIVVWRGLHGYGCCCCHVSLLYWWHFKYFTTRVCWVLVLSAVKIIGQMMAIYCRSRRHQVTIILLALCAVNCLLCYIAALLYGCTLALDILYHTLQSSLLATACSSAAFLLHWVSSLFTRLIGQQPVTRRAALTFPFKGQNRWGVLLLAGLNWMRLL